MRFLRNIFLVTAVVLLGYCGFALADGWIFQRRQSARFDQLLHASVSTAGVPASVAGGMLGRIEVPRLGVSVMVVEGTGAAILRHAAGHIVGTVMPGEIGNVGISAHRDTLFRPLRNIRQQDEITVTTLRGEYRYRVVSTRIVAPDDGAVLDSGSSEVLTLVTCYPFYFVGPAPERFIVRAERVM